MALIVSLVRWPINLIGPLNSLCTVAVLEEKKGDLESLKEEKAQTPMLLNFEAST